VQGHARLAVEARRSWPAPQRAHRGRRSYRVRPRLQDGPRRHRVEAQGLDLSLRPIIRLAQDEEPGLCGGAPGGSGGLGGVANALRSASISGGRAEPRIGLVHLRLGQPSIAVNFIATRVPNRATRPYLPRSSSALVMRRQSPANLSRQMATGFGCDGCRVGTVVGIRSVRG